MKKIKNPINDAFIAHYIMGETKEDKGKGKQASSSQAPPSQPEQQNEPTPIPPNATFDFASYAQWQHESNMHTWNMLPATNRAHTYFQQSQYLMQQQVGYPPEIMEQFMTLTAFQAYVNWPEDDPNAYGGGEFYAGNEDENMAEDVGGNVNEEGMEQDDPTHVHNDLHSRR